jgi:hypothetical protein
MMIRIVLMHKVTNSKWKKTWNQVCAWFRVKTVFLLLCAGLYSCTERTEFDVSQTGIFSKFVPQPVLLSLFSPGDSCRITTGVTTHSFTLNNSVNNVIPDFGYLESLETGERHKLIIDKEGKGLYYSPVNFTEGGVYSVFLRFSSIQVEPIEATDTIPFASTINKLNLTPKVKNVNDNLLTRVRLEVLPAELNPFSFYEVSVKTEVTDSVSPDGFYIDENLRMPSFTYLSSDDPLITKEDYYPSILQLDAFPPRKLYFKKTHYNEAFAVEFYYDPPSVHTTTVSENGEQKNTYHIFSHRAHIELRTVSSSYYRYHVSRLTQFYSREGDALYGAGSPVNVYSNIVNGTGIFAAFASDSITFRYDYY